MSDELDSSPSRDQRVDEIIAAYLEAVDAGRTPDRQELLARHPDLAAELEIFFADHDRVDQLAQPLRLPSPPPSLGTAPDDGATGVYGEGQPATLASGETPLVGPPLGTKVRYIGDYELLEELGRGGMGVVYKARQSKLNRLVALKMILAGEHAGEKELARFRSEAEAVARLQHPHIVQIFEVGEYEGHPYFSLEFVDGGSLAQQLDGTPLPPHKAARLVETLARAMHTAHQAGIVHRDLKPANVLLTADGAPKITDFGLAKKLDDAAGPTASNAIMGTPSYMAPEQAGGGSKEVGPAADVYALGAILYELLTGRPPFKAATPLDTLSQVVGDEPAPPRQLNPQAPRDLETICLKCLQKDPRKRYTTAAVLAEDLERFLAGRPIAARPVGSVERAWRWCRRSPVVAALTGAIAASLLAGTAVATHFAIQASDRAVEAENEKRRADTEAAEARDSAGKAANEKERADGKAAEALEQRRLAEQGEAEANAQLDCARRTLMTTQLLRVAAVMERDPGQGLELLDDTNACPLDLRDFTWRFYYRLCKRDRLTLVGHTMHVTCLAFSPDGKTVAAGDESGMVKLWDAVTGHEGASFKINLMTIGGVTSVAFSPDGKTLAAGGQDSASGAVKLWDLATGKERANLKQPQYVRAVAFSPDGKTLAAAGGTWVDTSCEVKLWDAATGKERASLKGHAGFVTSVAFSPDGKTLASGDWHGTVKLWDVDVGKERAALTTFGVASVAFSPDGKTLAAGSERGPGGQVKLWDAATGKERATLPLSFNGKVTSVAFSPDGKALAVGRDDGTVRLWDLAAGKEHTILKHNQGVTSVAFSPDGRTLATGDEDQTVKLWDVDFARGGATIEGTFGPGVFSPDGKTLAARSLDKAITLWDAATGKERARLPAAGDPLAFSPDGKTLTSFIDGDRVKLWDVVTGRERASLKGASDAIFSPDGMTLAGLSPEGTIKLWDVGTGQERASFQGASYGLAFSPDGKTLVSASDDQTIKLWDVATGQERAALPYVGGFSSVVFSPDGKILAAASGTLGDTICEVKLWDGATGKERARLKGASAPIFSPDGKTLVLVGLEGMVKLWDVTAGKERASFQGASYQLAFSPDGKTLASASGDLDSTVKLWDVVTGQECASLKGAGAPIFSPDGKTLAEYGCLGGIKLWDAAPPQERGAFRGAGRVVAFTTDGKTLASEEGDDESGECRLRLWDVATGKKRATFSRHAGFARNEVFATNGKILFLGSEAEHTVTLWDVAAGEECFTLKGVGDAVALSPDGQTVAALASDNNGTGKGGATVKLWDAATGWERAAFEAGIHDFDVKSLAFSPDSTTLALDGGEMLKLFDAATGRERATLQSPSGPTGPRVIFALDGKTLVWGDGLWDVATARERAPLKEAGYAVAFSPDGKTLAANHTLWDVASGTERFNLKKGPTVGFWVVSVAFSSDGKTVAWPGSHGTVELWDVASGQERATFRASTSEVTSLAFAPDGKTLASSDGTTLKLWDVPPADATPATNPARPKE